MRDVRLLEGPLVPEAALAGFAAAHPAAGGIASFIGKVRPEQGVEALELSHYEPLTLPAMQALAATVGLRWPAAHAGREQPRPAARSAVEF